MVGHRDVVEKISPCGIGGKTAPGDFETGQIRRLRWKHPMLNLPRQIQVFFDDDQRTMRTAPAILRETDEPGDPGERDDVDQIDEVHLERQFSPLEYQIERDDRQN